MKYTPLDLDTIHTTSIQERASKVRTDDFARPAHAHASFADFFSALPTILFGKDLRAVVAAIVKAHRAQRVVMLGMGAHVIKCGLSTVLIDLMERGVIRGVAMNGAGAIHDVEIALVGRTSEDVQSGLRDGMFGMARETGDFFDAATTQRAEMGLGAALGQHLLDTGAPFNHLSILATAARLEVPATVHVAIGTDIVHMRMGDGMTRLSHASFTDFRLFAAVVRDLAGGVYLNVGSAVIMPEVFLKAFTIAQNLGTELHDVTTVDLDMVAHYRPTENVVRRPASVGGQGYTLTGRHEVLLPLLAFAVVDALAHTE